VNDLWRASVVICAALSVGSCEKWWHIAGTYAKTSHDCSALRVLCSTDSTLIDIDADGCRDVPVAIPACLGLFRTGEMVTNSYKGQKL
jgi:hypothetical protein